ncbi:MAG: type I-B CRISPR-associated protein Cas5b [Candidatus Thermoplasmatota archaeon]
MENKKIIAFDLYGDYALFKKAWCNREKQSYLIPPKTSLIGLLGSILGYKRENYLKKLNFNEIFTGIKLISEEGKELHGFNFMHGKNLDNITKKFSNPYRNPTKKGSRSPTRLEFVKNPYYRIYIYAEDDSLRTKLQDYIGKNKCVFPPYLGQVNLFANIDNFSEINLIEKTIEYSDTAVPSEMVKVTEIKSRLYMERLPVKMKSDRSSPVYKSIAVMKNEDIPLKKLEKNEFIAGITDGKERLVLF